MAKRSGFLSYLKKAFTNHWNLLFFGAGVVAGALSGHADIALPLIAAGEITYLAGLAGHPKFQAYVDALEHKQNKEKVAEDVTNVALGRMFAALDPKSRARFEYARRRAKQLRAMAKDMQPHGTGGIEHIDELQVEGINKLLWAFMKLLYSRRSLAKFLATTDEGDIREQIANVEKRIEGLGDELEDTVEKTRIRRSLVDTLASLNLRLDNLTKAKQNFEFLELEIDRIDNKITSIAELAVNRQDPDFITSEVDGVAASMEHTEAAINELHLLDVETSDAPPPSFLDENLEQT
jgi:hypothetical protein